ncbi:hypothetical protein D3C72_817260 [compost metagenome]
MEIEKQLINAVLLPNQMGTKKVLTLQIKGTPKLPGQQLRKTLVISGNREIQKIGKTNRKT